MEKIPIWVWLGLALLVVYMLFKKATASTSGLASAAGYGAGKGAVDEALKKASGAGGGSALGSFLGGLFGGSSKSSGGAGPGGQSAAFSSEGSLSSPSGGAATAADLSKEGFDTSNYSTSEGFSFTDDSGNFVAG